MKSVFLLCLLSWLGFGKAPIVLTEDNFEHETQAVTGSTTGDWLVLFCDKKHRRCRELQDTWDELAGVLSGKINVA